MKLRVIIKKLSNPRVRRRLKMGLSGLFGAMMLVIVFKIVYDIGYFNAQALKKDKNAELSTAHPVLTMESAQRIVTGALKEDQTNPKTIVNHIVNDNYKLATIIIENNGIKKVAWIINMHLFFSSGLFNEEGYNLNEGIEQQYNINRGGH